MMIKNIAIALLASTATTLAVEDATPSSALRSRQLEEHAVWCGGHGASSCGACPQGNGAKWCNGECAWYGNTCIPKSEVPYFPHPASCSRKRRTLRYSPAVPAGTIVEAISPIDGSTLQLTATGESQIIAQPGAVGEFNDFFGFIKHRYGGFYLRFGNGHEWGPSCYCETNTPIGIDIDNSGAVERIEGEFKIDITGDGDMELLHEWFSPTEGILINMMPFIKDGQVTGQNLFGDMGRTYKDGFEKLELLDKDDDDIISGMELDGLAIWTDANSNARLDDGELSTLESHGIVGLRTDSDANDASSAVLKDGSEMYMEDLWFSR